MYNIKVVLFLDSAHSQMVACECGYIKQYIHIYAYTYVLSFVCKAEIFFSVHVHTHYLDTYTVCPFKSTASPLQFDKLLFFLTLRVNCVALPMESLFLDIDLFLTSIVK